MSTDPVPAVPDAPGLIGNGRSKSRTSTNISVAGRREVVTLKQVAQRPATHDTVVLSKLDIESATQLRDELDNAIRRAEE